MKTFRSFFYFAAVVCLTSCSTVKYTDIAKPSPAGKTLNEGYSILSSLMEDESNLDKILWIKDANPAVEDLIQEIAKTSHETRNRVVSLAAEKPGLNLTTPALPLVEAETRDAIAKDTRSMLLGNSGKAFEMRLLLTQVQAMNYASNLCQVLASSDPNPARSSFLKKQGQKFLKLREETVKQVGGL